MRTAVSPEQDAPGALHVPALSVCPAQAYTLQVGSLGDIALLDVPSIRYDGMHAKVGGGAGGGGRIGGLGGCGGGERAVGSGVIVA